MIKNPNIELVQIADDFIAVPVGDFALTFKNIVALSGPAAFLLKKLEQPRTKDELIELLISEYEVEQDVATADVDKFIEELSTIDIIKQQ